MHSQVIQEQRPLAFLRISFGALMMVYSAGKCSENLLQKRDLGLSFHSFSKRLASPIYSAFVENYPWFTRQDLYWKFHAPLMLLSAAGITFAFGNVSRGSSLLFFVMKMVLTLQTQHNHNNHEYLYALIALAIFLLPGHDIEHSFIGKVVMEAHDSKSGSHRSGTALGADKALLMALVGISYMMLQNAVYGIAGSVAPLGMGLLVWPSIVMLLGQAKRRAGNHENSDDSGHVMTIRNSIRLMRLFFAMVYFYAGLAKTGQDWLSGRTVRELIGLWTGPTAPALLKHTLSRAPQTLYTFVIWGGLLLDLTSAFGLNVGPLYSKVFFALSLVVFHAANHFLFVIETFPWVMVSALCVQFDSFWMDTCAWNVHYVMTKIRAVRAKAALMWAWTSRICTIFAGVSLTMLVILHIAIPLPCALHAILDDGSLAWGSQCQYWSWRMMTRSSRALPVSLLFRRKRNSENGNQISHNSREWLYETCLRGVWQEVAPYEDRLLALVQNYRGKRGFNGDAPRGDSTTETISRYDYLDDVLTEKYADVWVEINGPPFQRYVHPNLDLSKQHISSPGSLGALWRLYLRDLRWGPRPLAPWVMPRILPLRTGAWQRRFDDFKRNINAGYCVSDHDKDGNCTMTVPKGDSHVEVIFLADEKGMRPVQISTLVDDETDPACNGHHTLEMQLLQGHAELLNIDEPANLAAGACLRFEGSVVLQAHGEEPVVWAVMASKRTQCSGLHDKLRISSAVHSVPPPLLSRLHLAHPQKSEQSIGEYPAVFQHCVDLAV